MMKGKDSRALILALLLALGMPSLLISQAAPTAEPQPATVDPETANRVLLAISSNTYPVIPGDTYRYSYRTGGVNVLNDVIVDSNYTLNLNIFGKIDAHGKTYTQVKAEAERLISRAYPNSLPTFTLVSVGRFEVIVRGAIPQTAFIGAWGLTRLNDVVTGNLAAYSSLRNIRIVSRDGTTTTYDLLKALRRGDAEQNPYIKPGDVIEVSRADRTIEIRGEVYRPGSYQLLPDEGLDDLDFFAGGFTNNADLTRIRIERNREEMSTVVYFNYRSVVGEGLASGKVGFENGDILTVPSKTETMPVVFIEGALETGTQATGGLPPIIPSATTPPTAAGAPASTATPAAPVATGVPATTGGQGYNRIVYPFRQGETVFDAMNSIKASIAPFASLSQAYILRQNGEERLQIDLERLLYDFTAKASDVPLQPFDRIIIPSSNYDITVTGDLSAPGRYPFVPQKKLDYYVNLAGGVEILTGDTQSQVSLFNSDGIKKDSASFVEPGDRIYVRPNSNVVTVNGGVTTPGVYPYIPQETYEYYVGQAGGYDFERTAEGRATVYSISGKKRESTDFVQPGDRIYVHTDNFMYNFGRYFPIITTSLTFITTMVTLVNLLAGRPAD